MTRLSKHRDAELGSASIAQTEPLVQSLGWTLKQVQDDNETKAGVDR